MGVSHKVIQKSAAKMGVGMSKDIANLLNLDTSGEKEK
jgi:hypothetical protein